MAINFRNICELFFRTNLFNDCPSRGRRVNNVITEYCYFKYIFYKKISSSWLCIIEISALGTLPSRAAITFPFIILLMIYTLWFCFSNSVSFLYKVVISFFSVLSLVFITFNIEHILNDRQLHRIQRLESLTDEPRYEVYSRALKLISESPVMGYGAGSTEKVFNGTYPHNIFLDVLFNGGLFLLIPLLIIVTKYLKLLISSLKWDKIYWEHLSILSISFFLFLQWNISFGLDTIYIPISSIMMCCIFISDKGNCK
ncbi:O-antigen ligase family protein [Vibrio cyclitrophicus]|uniref:O-antigen ligase family protein n=1 Tax=Vibrio cyclitrophicus TaxID=47951 RepID=UPI0038B67984